MKNTTRVQFAAYQERIAELNGVSSVTEQFSVEPSVQQRLEQRQQESSDFLSRINVIGVDELKGEKVGVGVSSTIAGRTDTSGDKVRMPRDVSGIDSQGYECHNTDFDTAIRYALLDAWAGHKDFQNKLRDAILKRQALDRLMIGFHGHSAAATTDRTANPNLEDVNIGWLQQYRTHAPARVMASGKTAGKITIGSAADSDYANLDAMVYDMVSSLIDPWHRRDPGLVVVLGRDLLHDKFFPMVNKDQPSTEKLATDVILSQKRMGGLQVAEVPYMPDGTLMVTSLSNLSLYYQNGGRRRYMKEAPEKNRIENYESSNDAYVVEDYGMGCVSEKIEIGA